VTHGIEPADLRLHQPTLEDVYLRLIGPTSRREAAVRKLAETTWVELGVAADEVLKTVAVRTRGTYVLAVVPASRRLELRLVRESLDDPDARWLASEAELRVDVPGYELGSLLGVRLVVDSAVLGHQTVLFAAGTETESIRVRAGKLFRHEPLTLRQLTR
jgi:prolyl-tRNA editing enzyme YbaK/EbsC (Cys-tRNA(Pro) deacylase)